MPEVLPRSPLVIMPVMPVSSEPILSSPLARPAHNIYMQNVSLRWGTWELVTSPWQRKQKMFTRRLAWFFVSHIRVLSSDGHKPQMWGESQCPGEAGQHSHKLRVSHNLTHRISHHIITGRMEHPPAVRLTYNLDKAKYVSSFQDK